MRGGRRWSVAWVHRDERSGNRWSPGGCPRPSYCLVQARSDGARVSAHQGVSDVFRLQSSPDRYEVGRYSTFLGGRSRCTPGSLARRGVRVRTMLNGRSWRIWVSYPTARNWPTGVIGGQRTPRPAIPPSVYCSRARKTGYPLGRPVRLTVRTSELLHPLYVIRLPFRREDGSIHIVRAQGNQERLPGGRGSSLTRNPSASRVSVAMQHNNRDAADAFLFERSRTK